MIVVPLAMLRRLSRLLIALTLLFAVQSGARAAGEPTEQGVRAAMVFNFLKFTEWPAAAGAELLLCSASADPNLASAIDALAGRQVGNKRLATGRFRPEAGCNAIYVDTRRHWNEISQGRTQGRALTIGGYPGFVRDGGMIEIAMREGGRRIDINPAEAGRAGLRFHPQLLRLAGVEARGATVWIAFSETGGAHAEAAAAVAAEIERPGAGQGEVVVRHWREFPADETPAPRLIVAVGSQAQRGIIDSGHTAPLLGVLATRPTDARAMADAGGRNHTSVLLEQPPARQIAALKLALPERRRIGMLLGPGSRGEEETFRRAAANAGAELIVGRVDSPDMLGGVLQRTLEGSELLLAVADPMVFNNASVQNILTATYRQRVPLVAFSPSYVKAGALLAVYSTPAQVGRQAGEMARAFLSGRPLPPPQAPQDFVVSINAEVARSLGIPLQAADEQSLVRQLRAAERKP